MVGQLKLIWKSLLIWKKFLFIYFCYPKWQKIDDNLTLVGIHGCTCKHPVWMTCEENLLGCMKTLSLLSSVVLVGIWSGLFHWLYDRFLVIWLYSQMSNSPLFWLSIDANPLLPFSVQFRVLGFFNMLRATQASLSLGLPGGGCIVQFVWLCLQCSYW